MVHFHPLFGGKRFVLVHKCLFGNVELGVAVTFAKKFTLSQTILSDVRNAFIHRRSAIRQMGLDVLATITTALPIGQMAISGGQKALQTLAFVRLIAHPTFCNA
jgi:hypothetical protein